MIKKISKVLFYTLFGLLVGLILSGAILSLIFCIDFLFKNYAFVELMFKFLGKSFLVLFYVFAALLALVISYFLGEEWFNKIVNKFTNKGETKK